MFDERRLLHNLATEGGYSVSQTIDVVCHEIAHQW